MWKTREIITLLLTAVTVSVLVYRTIQDKAEVTQAPSPVVEGRSQTMPEYLYYIQARVLIGAQAFFKDITKKLEQRGEPASLVTAQAVDTTLRSSLTSINQAANKAIIGVGGAERSARRYLNRKELIVYDRLGFTPPEELKRSLEIEDRAESEKKVDEVLTRTLQLERDARDSLSLEDQSTLKDQLGWFGELVLTGSSETELMTAAKDAFIRFLTGLTIFFTAVGAGFIILIVLIVRFYSGKTTWKFQPPTIHSVLCLETFLIYLILMYALSYLIAWLLPRGLAGFLGPRLGSGAPLMLNVVVISSTVLVILWPLFWRERFGDVCRSFGLFIDSKKTLVRDLFLAPICYLASVIPMLMMIIAYSKILELLNIDISSGAHPVVPLLMKANEPAIIGLVFFLAVVVAPVIEEIFFRGALYSYVRTRLGRWSSILLTSVLFAAVHPQGVVGIVPLTAIGCILAFLREWRNSLVTPMLAHACFNGVTLFLVTRIFLD